MWIVLFVVAAILSLPMYAQAACIGSSPTLTAASTSLAEVTLCYNAAVAGDRINIPAGTSAWASPLSITKHNLHIIGAGVGVTTITGNAFAIGAVDGIEISGISMTNWVAGSPTVAFQLRGAHGINIHDNLFSCPTWSTWVWPSANPARTRYNTGVFHHNTFDTCRWTIADGYDGTSSDSALDGDLAWSSADPLGTSDNLFFEDNIAQFTTTCPQGTAGIQCNWIDQRGAGSRTVVRFNTIRNTYLECHPNLVDLTQPSNQNGHRGPRMMEAYGNFFDCTDTRCTGFVRPGLMKCNSFWWHNKLVATVGTSYGSISMQDDRGYTGSGIYGRYPCNGTTSIIDGNTSPAATYRGWPCMDQPGTSTDSFKWNGTNPAPVQSYRPNYHFKNIRLSNGTEWDYDVNPSDWNPVQIKSDRDFFGYVNGFNGTTGVGEGTSLPATCTTNPSGESRTVGWGPGFWLTTGGGNWNTSSSNPQGVDVGGADGALYVCTATNTWTVKYTPYTYPHPSQTGGGGGDPVPGAPAAPQNPYIVKPDASTDLSIAMVSHP